MPKNQASYINNKLLSAGSVDIFCHVSTDEDGFNSAKIMHEYLEENGIKTRIICSQAKRNLEYDEDKYSIIQTENIPSDITKADVALCVDFSEEERLRGGALSYLRSFSDDDILCIDHHKGKKILVDDFVLISEKTDEAPVIDKPKNAYIDSTAASLTSVLTRFFESLGINMSENMKKSAYCGMLDDMNKSAFVELNSNGTVTKTKKLKEDKNANEVFDFLENNTTKEDKDKVLSHLNALSKLTSEEMAFRKSLFTRMMLSSNSKFAYAVIAPDEDGWEKIGGDNPTTSKILRDFRIRTLEHKEPDEFMGKRQINCLKNVEAVAVFYPDYKTKRYRISMHSNKDFAEKIINYNKKHYNKDLIAGGHPNRAGGSMAGLDIEACKKWVQDFVMSAENISYQD